MVRFTTKKIDSLTLGERMKKMRDERRLSLGEISKSTKIQVKYLEYMEDGLYAKLPADVYVKGFLRSYAIFMGLNERTLIKQYEREKGIHKNIKKVVENENGSGVPIKFSNLVITPKIIIVCFIFFVVIGGFLYLYAEVNNFVSKPRLAIMTPTDGSTISRTSTHVTGLAEKDALVFINDQPVMVSEKGEFSQDVGLKSGVNMINVKARSKFDKETVQSVTVNADFQNQVSEQQSEFNSDGEIPSISEKVTLEVYVSPNPTWMSIEADGNLVYNGVLLPDATQSFDANEKISITSGKGNGTFVKVNGKPAEVLSDDPGVVRDVVYDLKGKVEKRN